MRTLKRVAIVALTVGSLGAIVAGCSESRSSAVSDGSPSSIPALHPDAVLPPNEPHSWELSVHCGAGFFSYRINGKWWRTAEGAGPSWMPAEWGDTNNRTSGVPVVLEVDAAGIELRASYAGRTVVYTPTELTEADLCD